MTNDQCTAKSAVWTTMLGNCRPCSPSPQPSPLGRGSRLRPSLRSDQGSPHLNLSCHWSLAIDHWSLCPPAACRRQQRAQFSRAFTLLELLIVISIIGILTAVALPHLKGLTRSNVMASANQQLLDDLALARQRAMNSRSAIYVVFMAPIDPNELRYLRQPQRNQTFALQYR